MAEQVLWNADELKGRERGYSQRLNPNSYYRGTLLSRLAGMTRAHVSLVRLPPGKDSFAYHAHRIEEEWIYILSGRGIALIDGTEHEVGPGDFMGFGTPAVAHLMKNPFKEEVVYLMGGEFPPLDVIDYPHLGKRYLLLRGDGPTQFFELGEPVRPFGPVEDALAFLNRQRGRKLSEGKAMALANEARAWARRSHRRRKSRPKSK